MNENKTNINWLRQFSQDQLQNHIKYEKSER